MDDLPLRPSAEAALGTGEVVRDLFAALARAGGLAADLLGRLERPGPGASGAVASDAVARADLAAAASLESDRLGDVLVRPEHLVLGWARATGSGLGRVREELQLLVADRAQAEYEAVRPLHREDAARPPVAVLLAGVPGTGKSTLAEALAWRLRAPVFSMDWQLGALVPFGALRPDNTAPLAETNLVASLARQLQLGLDVVVDATGHRRELRDRLRSVTGRLGGTFTGVECVCSDEEVQRGRVEARERGIPGWHATVSWEHVLRMKSLWESWDEPHLVVDSAVETPGSALLKVLEAVGPPGAANPGPGDPRPR
ncbi:AAA family ATPase [Actinosynnema sp. NPDC059797]